MQSYVGHEAHLKIEREKEYFLQLALQELLEKMHQGKLTHAGRSLGSTDKKGSEGNSKLVFRMQKESTSYTCKCSLVHILASDWCRLGSTHRRTTMRRTLSAYLLQASLAIGRPVY